MNRSERQRHHQKLKCEMWAEKRVNGSFEVKKLNGLREYAIDKLTPNLAKDLNIDIELIEKSLNKNMPDFTFTTTFSDLDVNVANVLLCYLKGGNPFKGKQGGRIRNKEQYYAALYAWLNTNNISATALLFGKDISSFKRDMGTFAKYLDIQPFELYSLRAVSDNRGIMEMAKQCFIDYMNSNHHEKWEDWIRSKIKN